MDPFSFASSEDLNTSVSLRIGALEGQQNAIPFSTLLKRPDLRHIGSNLSPHSDLYVTVQVWADCKPLTVPVQTSYKAFKTSRTWNEWLTLPISYSNLPLSAQLAITIWDLSPKAGNEGGNHAIPFGGTTVPLFEKDNVLQKGRQKCLVHRKKAADGLSASTTPFVAQPKRGSVGGIPINAPEDEEMDRLEKLFKKHEMGEIPRIDWLDNLVFRGVEKQGLIASEASKRALRQKKNLEAESSASSLGEANEASATKEKPVDLDSSDFSKDEKFILYIDLPRFDHPIVFCDHEYPAPRISVQTHLNLSSSNITLKPPPEVQFGPGIDAGVDGSSYGGRLVTIYDPEVGAKDNPAESKHRRLVRSQRTDALDRDLRPNAKIRDELNAIMEHSPTHDLNLEEKDLVWKFRFHLTKDKRALTKFVKSVNWSDRGESRQAVQILPKWTKINVDDALELLGPSFDNPTVRSYAVNRLRDSKDEELLLYLLQLVQALKFEKTLSGEANYQTPDSSLANFLISRAVGNPVLGNYLHWYLIVECDDHGSDQANENRKLYAKVEFNFMAELVKVSVDLSLIPTSLDSVTYQSKAPNGAQRRKTLLRQGELITVLSKISKEIQYSREDRRRKVDRLKLFVADPKNELVTFDPPLSLPLDPSVEIIGCFPDECSVFKSSLFPLLIPFKTKTGTRYPIIFKTGDDLRQDQLVIQIITLMDRLLRKENLDLKLSPYRILATSANAGAVQFVASMSLAAVVAKYRNGILAYLKANNPDDSQPTGVTRETMDTYIKSCAGYCVITYLLGVGDRHLDNLLLAPDGHFFHADFGFILGRDPKPFAPAMKLCKEMVEGMGSSSSPNYAAFKQYCFTAYTTLRKSSNLILNLFSLMVDANIPDIKSEPDKVVGKVGERFHLELSEEEAIQHFDRLIEDSVNAIFPVVIDRLHGFVQNWRA
ncbi:MAG: Phosphatidylinositol (PI) 3-kinase [Trizodia sp. TS-e1964]|nr:MAG: Phosphatidylinositol (PI) 3-kinase [Trizodia sp. TS-e1964]